MTIYDTFMQFFLCGLALLAIVLVLLCFVLVCLAVIAMCEKLFYRSCNLLEDYRNGRSAQEL